MSAYPRLNRAALRAAVRELTAIHSTDIVSDARINDLLNQRLFQIQKWGDDLSPLDTPVTVTGIDGRTYRFFGWLWDNTTQFPTKVFNDLYMESDSDTAPWDGGQYDMVLVYGAAADVLSLINDDSGRVNEFKTKFTELANTLIRDEFISHNMFLASLYKYNTTIFGAQPISLTVYAMSYLEDVISIDTKPDITFILWDLIHSEKNSLFTAFKWPNTMTNDFNSFSPYIEIFSYIAAARVAQMLGLAQTKVDALTQTYNSLKDTLLRDKLYSVSGNLNSSTIGNATSQVRALLQDFSNELPENVIYSWLNIAFQTLAQERAWPWLQLTANLSFPAGVNNINLTAFEMNNRVLNVYEVRYNGAGDVIDSEIVYPVPHTLDGKVGDAKYTYDVAGGFFIISPTPTETTYFRVRYILNTPSITGPSSLIYFDSRFADILAYRAAVIGSSWSDYGKKMRDVFQDTADKLFEGMVSFYMLDHSTEPMQLGGSALETKKYLPWFRTP